MILLLFFNPQYRIGAVHKQLHSRGLSSLRTRGEGGSLVADRLTPNFLKKIMCPSRIRGSLEEILRTGERNQFFLILCGHL